MSFVDYHVEGMVGVLTINRERQLNALNSQVLADLSAALDAVDISSVRCLIVTGAGKKAFVAGADISEMKDLDKAEGESFGTRGNAVMRKLESFPLPTIAAINGFALGGGCELAMSCDIRLCSEKAVFGQPEVSLGITPGFGGTQRLARIVGPGVAKELVYTARDIRASEALSIGLVNAVHPPEELMFKAMEMAQRIASNAPIAVRASKLAINEGMQVEIDSAIAIEQRLFGSCFATKDQESAMLSFLEKRGPVPFTNK